MGGFVEEGRAKGKSIIAENTARNFHQRSGLHELGNRG
jgi:hypothetical protein